MNASSKVNSTYLDLLFAGKNKQYGSYLLRKYYAKRALSSLLVFFALLGLIYVTSKVYATDTAVEPSVPVPKTNDVILVSLPDDDIKMPEVKVEKASRSTSNSSTTKFAVASIVRDKKIAPSQMLTDPNDDEHKNKAIGNNNHLGDNNQKDFNNPFDHNNDGKGSGGTSLAGSGVDTSNDVKTKVDAKARPPKGWMATLKKVLRYPEMAKVNQISGTVMLGFIVEKDGSITNVKIEGKDPGGGLGEEALRVIKLLGSFTPAVIAGKPVRTEHRLPLEFHLAEQ